MQASLVTADQGVDYGVKEVGPIIVALAFVIAVGGVAIATLIICGWKGAKSVGIDWVHKTVGIVCR